MGTGVDEVEVQKGPEERGQHFGEEREEERMNFGVVREEGEIFSSKTGYFGRGSEKCGKRVRKGVSPFQFWDGQNIPREKDAELYYRKKYFCALRRKVKKLEALARKHATQLKAKLRKIKTLQAKQKI